MKLLFQQPIRRFICLSTCLLHGLVQVLPASPAQKKAVLYGATPVGRIIGRWAADAGLDVVAVCDEERRGRNVYYAIADPRVRELLQMGDTIIADAAERVLSCQVLEGEGVS